MSDSGAAKLFRNEAVGCHRGRRSRVLLLGLRRVIVLHVGAEVLLRLQVDVDAEEGGCGGQTDRGLQPGRPGPAVDAAERSRRGRAGRRERSYRGRRCRSKQEVEI